MRVYKVASGILAAVPGMTVTEALRLAYYIVGQLERAEHEYESTRAT